MTGIDRARQILGEFGEAHGMELDLPEDATQSITTENGLDITFSVEDGTCIIATANLVPIPETAGQRFALFSSLLSANLFPDVTKNGTLTVVPIEEMVTYQNFFPLGEANANGFASFFALFTETAHGLRAACLESAEAGPQVGPGANAIWG